MPVINVLDGAISRKVDCQRFMIRNVAGSASWTHKHDGDNALKFIKIIFVDVGSGANWQYSSKKQEKFLGG